MPAPMRSHIARSLMLTSGPARLVFAMQATLLFEENPNRGIGYKAEVYIESCRSLWYATRCPRYLENLEHFLRNTSCLRATVFVLWIIATWCS